MIGMIKEEGKRDEDLFDFGIGKGVMGFVCLKSG